MQSFYVFSVVSSVFEQMVELSEILDAQKLMYNVIQYGYSPGLITSNSNELVLPQKSTPPTLLSSHCSLFPDCWSSFDTFPGKPLVALTSHLVGAYSVRSSHGLINFSSLFSLVNVHLPEKCVTHYLVRFKIIGVSIWEFIDSHYIQSAGLCSKLSLQLHSGYET